MSTPVVLPQWGMGMQEGTVVAWHKRQGDTVLEGEPLVEVEAEKATDTVPAPASGVLGTILVAEGQSAQIYDVLAVILEPGDATEPVVAEDGRAAASPTPSPENPQRTAPLTAEKPAVQVEPRARRLAASHGIDLSDVPGTGPGGRITEDDVRRALERSSVHAERSIALAGARGMIARQMLYAVQHMALLTLTSNVDVTSLVAYRLRSEDAVSVTDLAIKAAALALKHDPRLNSTIDGDTIRVLDDVHIGVAVSTGDSLVVPVVRNADHKSLRAISEERRELVERARKADLDSRDLEGGTFTITNLGSYGIDAFTPIVNPPQAAILGIGAIRDWPVRDNGLAWRQYITLSLTFDHRVTDGAPAAELLRSIAERLDDPDAL